MKIFKLKILTYNTEEWLLFAECQSGILCILPVTLVDSILWMVQTQMEYADDVLWTLKFIQCCSSSDRLSVTFLIDSHFALTWQHALYYIPY